MGLSCEMKGFPMSSDYSNYVFNISANNTVLSVAKIDSRGRMRSERIDANETYSVMDGYVVKQEFGRYGQTEWSVYADLSGTGRYTEVSDGKGPVDLPTLLADITALNAAAGPIVPGALVGYEHHIFAFDETGNVSAAGEINRSGFVEADYIAANETYSVVDGYVIKEEVGRYGQVEWSVFADADADGRYTEVAEGKGAVDYLSLTQSLDQLGPDIEAIGFKFELGNENKVFTFGANDTVTGVSEVNRYGRLKAERIDFNETYERVGDFVVKTETSRYGQTEWTVYANGDNDDRWAEIAEGHGPVNVDLLAQLIPANFAAFG